MDTTSGTVFLEWIGSRMVMGTDSRGHSLAIGYQKDHEPQWNGAKPSDLLMLAAASCATYDVVEILEKQRQPLQNLTVSCTGEQITEPPYQFISLHLHYEATGDIDPEKMDRAIALSQEKYCSVLMTLEPAVEISYDFQINPQG
jgi:putative redox protein